LLASLGKAHLSTERPPMTQHPTTDPGFAAPGCGAPEFDAPGLDAPGFDADLAAGRLTRAGYALYARELFEVYTALEDAAVALAGDPLAAPFLLAGLRRRRALATDLEYFHGPHWEADLHDLPPLPATRRYAERIRAVAPASP